MTARWAGLRRLCEAVVMIGVALAPPSHASSSPPPTCDRSLASLGTAPASGQRATVMPAVFAHGFVSNGKPYETLPES
jgi:hypothetical protein